MNIILLPYIIFTALLTILNVTLIKKNAYLEALVKYRIIDKTKKHSKNIKILLGLDILYFIIYIIISMINALTGSLLSVTALFVVLAVHIGAFIFYDYATYDKGKLIAYALDKTDTSSSVIEFKVDAYLIEQENPKYLRNKDSAEDNEDKFNVASLLTTKSYKVKPLYFPLYRELLTFMGILHDTSVEANSPLVNAYIVENITLLSTIMTILKDEKLVESLKSDLGKQELEDLTQSLIAISKDTKKITTYIKKEKITFSKAADSAEVIEGLNKIRSMKEFNALVK